MGVLEREDFSLGTVLAQARTEANLDVGINFLQLLARFDGGLDAQFRLLIFLCG